MQYLPAIGGPNMHEPPLKRLSRPNALVSLSKPSSSTSIIDVRQI